MSAGFIHEGNKPRLSALRTRLEREYMATERQRTRRKEIGQDTEENQ